MEVSHPLVKKQVGEEQLDMDLCKLIYDKISDERMTLKAGFTPSLNSPRDIFPGECMLVSIN